MVHSHEHNQQAIHSVPHSLWMSGEIHWNYTEVDEIQEQSIGIEQKSTETQQILGEFRRNQRNYEEVHRHYNRK